MTANERVTNSTPRATARARVSTGRSTPLQAGNFEGDKGDPAHHLERIVETVEKLDGLEEEIDDATARRHVTNRREHLETDIGERNEGPRRRPACRRIPDNA